MDNPFDYTLTVRNVINEIEPVTRWFELGLQLDIEHHELEKIRNNNRDQTDPCKMEMVAHWLKNDPTSTWKKLCEALEKICEARVAQQIVSDYPKLKREYEEKREMSQILFEQEITNGRIEDEQWRKFWEEAKSKRRTESTQGENKEATRDAFRKLGLEWLYDLFTKSTTDREELEHIKEKMQAQAEEGRILKERAKKLEKRKKALCNKAEEFEKIQEDLRHDEEELHRRAQKLKEFNWSQWLVHSSECDSKLTQCQRRLRICQEQSQICKKVLKDSGSQLSDCRNKIESCIYEMHFLHKEYERCSRSVKANMGALETAQSRLIAAIKEIATSTVEGAKHGANTVGTAVSSTVEGVGIAAGYVGKAAGYVGGPGVGIAAKYIGGAAGYVGRAAGYAGKAAGRAAGYVGGAVVGGAVGVVAAGAHAVSASDYSSQLKSCDKELDACKKTLKECQTVAEQVKKEVDELNELMCD